MNDELIEQLIEVVTKYPKRYAQDTFGVEGGHRYKDWVINGSCDSPCCIAGHVMILTGNRIPCKWDWGTLGQADWLSVEMYNKLKDNASKELGITRDQGLALFSSRWPRVWIDGNGPLPLARAGYLQTDERVYSPTAEDAIKVLDRLLHYGFSHPTFEEYHRERERDNE